MNMKTKALIFFLVTGLMIPSVSMAQLGGALRNRLNNAINKGIENKIDSTVEKQAAEKQAAEKQASEPASEEEQAAGNQERRGINIGGLLGGKVTLKYDESYSFSNRIFMQAEIYDKKEVARMDYYLYYREDAPYFGIEAKMLVEDEGQEQEILTSTVFDGVNKCILIMTDMGAMKMGIITAVPEEDQSGTTAADNPDMGTFTKTGNKKVIAGYSCDEYQYKDTETGDNGKVWVTGDLRLQADRRTWAKAGMPAYYGHSALDNGVVMATESYNSKGELEMKSETKEVSKGIKHSISTAGFSLRQMDFNQAGGSNRK
jgi:hypothetical protein